MKQLGDTPDYIEDRKSSSNVFRSNRQPSTGQSEMKSASCLAGDECKSFRDSEKDSSVLDNEFTTLMHAD